MPTWVINERNYPAGTFDSPEHPFSDNLTWAGIRLSRVNWPDLGTQYVIEATVEVSIDGGPWQFLSGVKDVGGVVNTPRGVRDWTWIFMRNLPPGVNRRIRAHVILAAPLRTQIEIEAG